MKNIFLFILFGGALVTLSSCATHKATFPSRQLAASEYLQLAATAGPTQKQIYLLQAAQRLMQDHQLKQARQVLDSIDHTLLTADEQNTLQLLKAEYRFITNRAIQALAILKPLQSLTTLSPAQQIILHQLLAKIALSQGNILESIRQHNYVLTLLSDQQAIVHNLTLTWQSLQTVTLSTLQTLLPQTQSEIEKGWIALALITKNVYPSTDKLLVALQQWQQTYPQHPAVYLLKNIKAEHAIYQQAPKNVALLLPLSGEFSGSAQAIRNGFFAAYYYAKQQGQQNLPAVRVYDTNSSATNTYQQAVKNGADFIVGPLLKNNIVALVKNNLVRVPTLALNQVAQHSNLLYQFSLSPTDEAQQVANKAWQDNHSNALVVAPNSTWGQNIAKTFSDTWQQLGGHVVGATAFTNQHSLNRQIAAVLNVSQSQERAHMLEHTLKETVRFLPRARKDFDCIFMVASPSEGRQIKPLLNFYFAGNIPVYTISTIFSGIVMPDKDGDLNGIIFNDMPWVIEPNKTLMPSELAIQQYIQTLWKASYQQYPTLFAFGVDAFHLIDELNKMALLPNFSYFGATGQLSLNPENNYLNRRLLWAQFRYGKPTLIQ